MRARSKLSWKTAACAPAITIGELLGVDVVVHLIGERPGTGLNMLSAYLTYGRDAAGQPRWSPSPWIIRSLTAICGIHRLGWHPAEAAKEIAASYAAKPRQPVFGNRIGQTRPPPVGMVCLRERLSRVRVVGRVILRARPTGSNCPSYRWAR